MKNLQSTIEGTWIEIKPVTLTKEQQTLMMSQEESDTEAKNALMAEIKSQREVSATKADKTLAVAKYAEVKPILKEGNTYELIAMDLVIDELKLSGILNCRVNGEHKQVRF